MSGAGRASRSRGVVVGRPWRWLAPTSPACRISRAIRWRPCCSPRIRRSAWTRGAPKVWRELVCTVLTRCSSSASATAWLEGERAIQRGVEARPGHAEHARHDEDRDGGLVRAHEPEEPDGTAPVSLANQAAAFNKISRSRRRCRFSRRSRDNSSRSAEVRPGRASSRRPSCLSARAIQLRTDCAVGSNSRARSSGSRPARAKSTIWRRNSGE